MQQSTAYSQDAVSLKRRLRAELRWLRLRLLAHCALMLLGGVGLLAAVVLAAGPAWTRLGSLGAWGALLALLVPSAWLVWSELVVPLRRIANLKGFTREVERHGEFRNVLEAATQFTSPRREDPLRYGASAELVAEVLHRARREAQDTALARRIPLVGAFSHLLLAVVALGGWLVLGLSSPQRLDRSLAALARPWSLARPIPTAGLHPLTRSVKVAVGGDVLLRARDLLGGEPQAVLEVNRTGDFWQGMPTELHPPGPGAVPYVDVAAKVSDVEDPFRYRFRKGRLLTPTFEVTVRERPVLRSLAAKLTPPAYTGRAPEQRDDLGGVISALEGTRVELTGRASVPLRSARRLQDERPAVPLRVSADTFSDTLLVRGDVSFRIGLTDQDGLEGDALTVYRFSAIADDPPTVQITQPGEDRVLDRSFRVGIAGVAADDVGLARLDLLYRREGDEEWTRRRLVRAGQKSADSPDIEGLQVEAGPREVAVGFVWNLSDERLMPGDDIGYCLEAVDNNALVGGRRARSTVYRLRLPTAAEVLQAQREEQGEQAEGLESVLEQGKQLQDTLERLSRELKKDPSPDWAKQQEIQEALKQQEALAQRAAEASKDLQQMLDKFERNNAGSVETLEKMQTIQELIDSLKNESLNEYMKAMREAMAQLSPQEVQRAMEEAQSNQEEYNRRLDRTIELLRQLQRERVMGDMVEELSEYLRRQQDLKDQTDRQEGQRGEQSQEQQPDAAQQQHPPAGQPADQAQRSEQPQAEQSPQGQQQQQQQGQPPQSKPGEQEQPRQSGERQMTPEELARAQQQLAEETKALEERLRQELDKLRQEQSQSGQQSPASEEMRKALEEALQQLQQQGKPSQSMQDAGQQLQQGNPEGANEPQEEAQTRLTFLYQTLSQGMQGMQQASKKDAVEKLQRTAYDLLNTSFGQETVLRALDGSVKGQRTAPVARDQARLSRGVQHVSDELHAMARDNFSVPEQLLASVRELTTSLQRAVDELELSRLRQAQDDATASMGMMNRIVMNLLTVAQSAGGGGGGSTSQQMEQLSMEQSRLNGMTQELRQKMQGGLSEQERRELAALRGRQEMLRKQLEQVHGQVKDERRVLGDLKEIGRQMEEVSGDLDAGRLSDETQRKQERILSRLLDAQRSIRERDFAKRRESRSAGELYTEQAGELLSSNREDQQAQIRRWLAPERAPHAYQEDVRRYFRQIQGKLDLPAQEEQR